MPSAAQHVLAIDLGTSGPKAGVVSEAGQVKGCAVRGVPTQFTPGGGAEHDPEAAWRACVEAGAEAVARSGVRKEDIAGVICDSHFSSLVCLGHDGAPAMNLMVWLDQRGARKSLARHAGFKPDSLWRQYQWFRIHGIPPLPGGLENLAKMRWVRFARPEVYEKTKAFLEPVDYIAYRLCGRIASNQCSIFMMLATDNRTLGQTHYDETLLRYSGIDRAKLPELLPMNGIVGGLLPHVAEQLGLVPGTPVVTGLNDTQAGGMACGAFQGSGAGIGMGSSGCLIAHVPRAKTDVFTSLFTIPSPVPDTWFVTAESGVAGRALEHFLDKIVFADDHFGRHAPEDLYAQADAAAGASPPGGNGTMFLPWMNGSQTPVSDADVRGGFLNVSLTTDRHDLARAVLEGVACQYHALAQAEQRFARRRFTHYVMYGGGALSRMWPQIFADVLQCPVRCMANPRYANCLGAGMLALERLGRIDFATMAQRIPIDRDCEPNAKLADLYAERVAVLNLAFKKNRPIFRRLNRKGPNHAG